MQGFGKGFSAAFYGAALYGLVFFGTYKMMKGFFREYFDGKYDLGLCYLLASCVTETISLSVKYPYDLIKCRLQSVNYVFKYQDLPHAFRKEIRGNGVMSLYRGSMLFLATQATFTMLEIPIYERLMLFFKRKWGMEEFEKSELYANMISGLIAGVVAASLTNPLEALTVAKQTQPDLNVLQMVRQEGMSLMTRGLVPRVVYNGSQCFIFFNLMLYVGKQYRVQFNED